MAADTRHADQPSSKAIAAARLEADGQAEKLLASGLRVIGDEQLYAVLQLWAFRPNSNRKNVIPEGQPSVSSDTLGLQKVYDGRQVSIANATLAYPNVTKLVNRYFRDNALAADGSGFGYTSISVNEGFAARRHRDGGNEGPSMTKAVGAFEGGRLLYWPDDDGGPAVADLPWAERTCLDSATEFVLFDGKRAHEVEPFCGQRMSFVFFTQDRWSAALPEQLQQLRELGFPVPTLRMMVEMRAALPEPLGYGARGRGSSGSSTPVRPRQLLKRSSSASAAPKPEQPAARQRRFPATTSVACRSSAAAVGDWEERLKPFQRDAVAKLQACRDSRRNLVVMGCGTGKSILQLATIFRSPEELAMLVVPTLELLWQHVCGFLEQDTTSPQGDASFRAMASCYQLFAYCSYDRRKLRQELLRISAMQSESDKQCEELYQAFTQRCQCGTSEESLNDFLQSSSTRKMLIVTYCSFEAVKAVLTEVLSASGDRRHVGLVGEMVFDEAHHAAGKLKRDVIMSDWPQMAFRRQTFWTATPVRKGIGEYAFDMYKDCGAAAYSYNLAEALRDKVCRRVAVSLFPTADGPELESDRRKWLYENIIRRCFLNTEVQAWNILTYHQLSVCGDSEHGTVMCFVDEPLFKDVVDRIQRQEFPEQPMRFRDEHGGLDVRMFGLTMESKNVRSILNTFQDAEGGSGQQGRIRLIASCGLINEGINTKTANLLIPISASQSSSKNIQRLGRIQRNVAWGADSPPSHLMLPIPRFTPSPELDEWDSNRELERYIEDGVGADMLRNILIVNYYQHMADSRAEVSAELQREMLKPDAPAAMFPRRPPQKGSAADRVDPEPGPRPRPVPKPAPSPVLQPASHPQARLPAVLQGTLPIMKMVEGAGLSVGFLPFAEMCNRIRTEGDYHKQPFAIKWMGYQHAHFHLLTAPQQMELETLPGWGQFHEHQGRRRRPFDRILDDLKAYAAEGGLDNLFLPPKQRPEGGLREQLLRRECQRLRTEYRQQGQSKRLKIKRSFSLSRMTPEHIAQLDAIPGWRWSLRQPRGTYKKSKANPKAADSKRQKARGSRRKTTKKRSRDDGYARGRAELRAAFKALGLDPSAPKIAIRRGYLRLARETHPDKHPEDVEAAKARFQVIRDAWGKLRDRLKIQTTS
eukprot:TRINITY_DN35696_c0_g1_i2.p1 TRINITY_DN35696_c0_g1~~TRINITY_DN35696_c0_g1_i2.p1  ORF type:complete len:1151 (-),score=194.30 TRINITY_DN35696_c0_g1_i2:189-3641(-)